MFRTCSDLPCDCTDGFLGLQSILVTRRCERTHGRGCDPECDTVSVCLHVEEFSKRVVPVTIDSVALWTFAASFVLPALAFVAGRAMGISTESLAGVMVGFWFPSLASSILAVIGVAEGAAGATRQLQSLLIANVVVYAILIIPKILLGRARQTTTREAPPNEPGRGREPSTREAVPAPGPDTVEARVTVCVPTRVNEGGGDVPSEKSGKSGTIGWDFLVANHYTWTLKLNITSDTPTSFSGFASATGEVSPWYSFIKKNRSAISETKGNIKCTHIKGSCAADANGGQDESTDADYSSAVVINGSRDGSWASLDIDLAAAVAGQVAISSIDAGGQIGGTGANVKLGASINMPGTAKDKKRVSRSYAYRCLEK
jgi:hypothetical protein